jgi:2-methylisocitrate lyase-like PEP mutase family enzyme/ribosomal protein S18 acetylase RimI-like enzyme
VTAVRRIEAREGGLLRALRLRALADAPSSFGTTYAEAAAYDHGYWADLARAGASGEHEAVFVAVRDGRGYAMVRGVAAPDEPGAVDLRSLWVDPTGRRSGTGRELVEAVVRWAEDRRAARVRLWVTTDNHAAKRLYRQCGFVETAQTQPLRSHPGLTQVLMVWETSIEGRSAMPTVAEKRRTFRRLHESGCFVIPNPWDTGTARYLQHLGFKALATTSSGAAYSMGLPDADWALTRDPMLAHIRSIVDASELPVNADFESGYADEPGPLAENVHRCVDTGVAGLSIEDSTGNPERPLYSFDLAVARIRAAREAIDRSGADVLLVGRSEGFIAGAPDLEETLRRLKAYAGAGADCLYAPGIRTREQIAAVVQAVAPKPVNLLIGAAIGLTAADAAALGVRRISVGGALSRSAWGAFMRAARGLAAGTFEALADAASGSDLNRFFEEDMQRRARGA